MYFTSSEGEALEVGKPVRLAQPLELDGRDRVQVLDLHSHAHRAGRLCLLVRQVEGVKDQPTRTVYPSRNSQKKPALDNSARA